MAILLQNKTQIISGDVLFFCKKYKRPEKLVVPTLLNFAKQVPGLERDCLFHAGGKQKWKLFPLSLSSNTWEFIGSSARIAKEKEKRLSSLYLGKFFSCRYNHLRSGVLWRPKGLRKGKAIQN